MATPKERHDARDLAEAGRLTNSAPGEGTEAELPPASAAPTGPESQGDGQPENELELHDHSAGPHATQRSARGHPGEKDGNSRT